MFYWQKVFDEDEAKFVVFLCEKFNFFFYALSFKWNANLFFHAQKITRIK